MIDIYFELYGEIKVKPEEQETIMRRSANLPQGIFLTIEDPENELIDTVLLAGAVDPDSRPAQEKLFHPHKSYHKRAALNGLYRICVRANRSLFRENPGLKYEMSLQIEALFELMYDEREEERAQEVEKHSSLVTKEHFDKVDLTITSLENKAESIISD